MTTEGEGTGYDTSIGSERRSVRSATKLWAVILGLVFLVGVALIITFFNSNLTTPNRPSSGANSASQSPGP